MNDAVSAHLSQSNDVLTQMDPNNPIYVQIETELSVYVTKFRKIIEAATNNFRKIPAFNPQKHRSERTPLLEELIAHIKKQKTKNATHE